MAHLDLSKDTKPAELSAREQHKWLNAASQVGEFVNHVAGRGDLVAKVGPGLGQGAPACFIPHIAEVEVDTTLCLAGVDPSEIALNDYTFRLGRSAFVGAISHEAAHARWSTLVPADLMKHFPEITNRIVDVFMVLEESRIEGKLVHSNPEYRKFLLACAGDIIARDYHIADDVYGASVSAGLILARVDAGVYDKDDEFIALVRNDVLTKIDEPTLALLEALWREFQSLEFIPVPSCSRTKRALEIAQEWLDALDIPKEDPTPNFATLPMSGEGEGEGGGDEEGEDEGNSIADAARERSMDAERENMTEKRAVVNEEAREEARAEAKRRAAAVKAAEKAFETTPEGAPGGGHGLGPTARRKLQESRLPKPAERAAAIKLARELERAQYRDRAVTKRTSVAPPGRLRSRGAVQRASESARGAILKAEPWQAKRRKHTDETPLTVGIMTDLSGSMMGAAEPSGVLSWVMSEAVRRIHGTVATVLFGAQVHGVVRAGARQTNVNIFEASDAFEAFKDGFEALDGELNLLNAEGARVLVLFTDACFVNSIHNMYATKAMKWCRERGVAVVWVDVNGGFSHNYGWGETVTTWGDDAVTAAAKIGRIAVSAINKANARAQAAS